MESDAAKLHRAAATKIEGGLESARNTMTLGAIDPLSGELRAVEMR